MKILDEYSRFKKESKQILDSLDRQIELARALAESMKKTNDYIEKCKLFATKGVKKKHV